MWSIQYVRTKAGRGDDYLRNLRSEWIPLMEEARQRGIIRGHRVFVTPQGGPDDWDIMLMVEVENMAALDGYSARMRALDREWRGDRVKQNCAAFRDALGTRLVREIEII